MKKALKHPRADEDKRRIFQNRIKGYERAGKTIVYIDESGFSKHMPRTHGYAPKGKRCYGKHDFNAKGRTNVIGAMLGTAFLTCWLCSFNIDSDGFNKWVEVNLLPKLRPGAVLVLDNATFHKRSDTQEIIKNAGHVLESLPPYSPDLNPIEQKWAQAKAMRREKQCSIDQLFAENKP